MTMKTCSADGLRVIFWAPALDVGLDAAGFCSCWVTVAETKRGIQLRCTWGWKQGDVTAHSGALCDTGNELEQNTGK